MLNMEALLLDQSKAKDVTLEEIKRDVFKDGSTWISLRSLYKKYKALDVDKHIKSKDLIIEEKGCESFATTREILSLERKCAEILSRYATFPTTYHKREEIDALIEKVEKDIGIKLADKQKDAIYTCVLNKVSYIAGIPGSGKTTVVKALIRVLGEIKEINSPITDVTYLAPTGKACNRLKESMGSKFIKAYTCDHFALSKEPIGKVVIIDESSMLNLETFEKMLEKISKEQGSKRLIFLGDRFQLTSVGAGTIFKDITQSLINGTFLEECFRQDKACKNLTSAIKEIVDCTFNFTEGEDFKLIKNPNPDKVVKGLACLYMQERLKYGEKNVALLIPFKKAGKVNSNTLNEEIIKMLTKGRKLVNGFFLGERVFQNINRPYATNGEIGTIIEAKEDSVKVIFDSGNGKSIPYTVANAKKELEPAYALSVHKSQGSEYQSIIVVGLKEHKFTLTKNLIYTGVTRAKKKCTFIYDTDVLSDCSKEASEMRNTFFTDILNEELVKRGIKEKEKGEFKERLAETL